MSTQTTASGERAALLAMARDLARRELLPRAGALDLGEDEAIAQCWHSLVEVGLDRALLSERHGGVELSVRDLLAALEELAVGDGGIAMCALLSNAALARLDEERLAEVAQGERWTFLPVRADAELTISDDGLLEGALSFALGAHGAGGLVLQDGRSQPSTLAIRTDADGVRVERDLAQMGLRAARGASVMLAQARAASISDAPGSGTAMTAADAIALLRAGSAAIARGIARRANELAFEYAQARRQGGVAIIEHEAVADMLSAMTVRLACKTQLAAGPDGLQIAPVAALSAKVSATDGAVVTTTDAVQVFGGTGYMVETGVEKLMRDAKYCQLFPEPNWLAQAELMRLQRAGSRSAVTEQ
jgi:alkylation response protein AidB-like acyl-CoA dehydrogenase